MGITSAIVLFAVIWFLTFLVVIPFRIQTQGDLGDVVEGTHAGAPQVHNLARKAKLTTAISAAIWTWCTTSNSMVISAWRWDIATRPASAASCC